MKIKLFIHHTNPFLSPSLSYLLTGYSLVLGSKRDYKIFKYPVSQFTLFMLGSPN